jgi:ER lumen protein retaining receptor
MLTVWFGHGVTWNIFRYSGDFSHLISILILLFKMLRKRSCAGISFNTQLLYLIVHVTRYCNSNFFTPPIYNLIFKIFYLVTAIAILVAMRTRLASTWNRRHDTFRVIFIIILCALLAIITGGLEYRSTRTLGHSIQIYFWAFSLWAEALAVLPQMILLGRSERVEGLIREHLFFMSIYRILYLFNWFYQFIHNRGPKYHVIYVASVLQTVIYADYIYVYCRAKVKGQELDLPR